MMIYVGRDGRSADSADISFLGRYPHETEFLKVGVVRLVPMNRSSVEQLFTSVDSIFVNANKHF